MEKGFGITFANSSKVFFPGQTIEGEIQIEVFRDLKIKELRLEFEGYADVEWKEYRYNGQYVQKVYFTEHEDYIQTIRPIKTPEPGKDHAVIQGGQQKFPFSFNLPSNLPPSFDGRWGKIEYCVRAVICKPYGLNTIRTAKFTVAGVNDLNIDTKASQQGLAEGSKNICCFLCKSGPLTGMLKTSKLGYVPGETIPVVAEIINHTRRDVTKAKISLVQISTFRGIDNCGRCCGCKHKVKTNKLKIVYATHRIVRGGDTETWTNNLKIPPLPVTSLEPCTIMDVKYQLQFNLTPNGPSFKLKIPLDIIIGSIPLASTATLYGVEGAASSTVLLPPNLSLPENVPPPDYVEATEEIQDKKKTQVGPQFSWEAKPSLVDDAYGDWKPKYVYYNWKDNQQVTFK